MSADGKWKITIKTPMGPQTFDAEIATDGDTFIGTSIGTIGEQALEGKLADDTLTWTTKIKAPMPMTLQFSMAIDGDTMAGAVNLGVFGKADLKGIRV